MRPTGLSEGWLWAQNRPLHILFSFLTLHQKMFWC